MVIMESGDFRVCMSTVQTVEIMQYVETVKCVEILECTVCGGVEIVEIYG